MDEKLKRLIDDSIFSQLILEGKQGIFTDELYRIGEKVWIAAQKDVIEKLEQFEKDEKILIITESDRDMLHGFDFTQIEHLNKRENLKKMFEEYK